MAKIQLYTESKTIKLTKQQANSLNVLKSYNVDVSRFIQDAIAEKIKRDWKSIKEECENFTKTIYVPV